MLQACTMSAIPKLQNHLRSPQQHFDYYYSNILTEMQRMGYSSIELTVLLKCLIIIWWYIRKIPGRQINNYSENMHVVLELIVQRTIIELHMISIVLRISQISAGRQNPIRCYTLYVTAFHTILKSNCEFFYFLRIHRLWNAFIYNVPHVLSDSNSSQIIKSNRNWWREIYTSWNFPQENEFSLACHFAIFCCSLLFQFSTTVEVQSFVCRIESDSVDV